MGCEVNYETKKAISTYTTELLTVMRVQDDENGTIRTKLEKYFEQVAREILKQATEEGRSFTP